MFLVLKYDSIISHVLSVEPVSHMQYVSMRGHIESNNRVMILDSFFTIILRHIFGILVI